MRERPTGEAEGECGERGPLLPSEAGGAATDVYAADALPAPDAEPLGTSGLRDRVRERRSPGLTLPYDGARTRPPRVSGDLETQDDTSVLSNRYILYSTLQDCIILFNVI